MESPFPCMCFSEEKRELTNEELTQEILAGVEGLDCEIQVTNSTMDMRLGSSSPFHFD